MTELKRKGKFLRHMPCTSPSCTSSDAMALYEQEDGTVNATCFSCGYFDANPEIPAERSQNDTEEDSGAISLWGVVKIASELPTRSLPERGIDLPTCEFYDVRVAFNGDGTPSAHYYPYYKGNELVGYKKRIVRDKSFYSIGDMRDCELFGQHLFSGGGRKLYITEGELDALSLFQAFKKLAGPGYGHLNPPVVSLPHGSNSVAASLSNNAEFLKKFDQIILVFDQDESGNKAVSEAAALLDPEKTRVARLSEKDANAMLMAHKEQELKWSCIDAQEYTPSGIATVSDLSHLAIAHPIVGSPWPWPTLTRLTFGRQPGVYGIGAGVGIGKTEFFHELAAYICYEDKRPIGIFFLEEAPARTLRSIAAKRISKNATRPDVEISEGELEAALDELQSPNKIFIFDHKGDRSWSSVYLQCKHLITVHGVKDIFIDPLTAVISHEESTDRVLHSIMDDMSRLTHDPYNASIYYSSHLNEPPRDRLPHEEGGRVTESQFAGSRAMVRYSDYIFGLERDKQAPDIFARNTTTLRVLKDRRYGFSTGENFDIYYDHITGRYLEKNDGF